MNTVAVEHIEFIVEEPSMEAALRTIVPKILNDVSFDVYAHQCKDERLKRLPDRLRGYAAWLRKIELARRVASEMVPARNISMSFRAFRTALTDLPDC